MADREVGTTRCVASDARHQSTTPTLRPKSARTVLEHSLVQRVSFDAVLLVLACCVSWFAPRDNVSHGKLCGRPAPGVLPMDLLTPIAPRWPPPYGPPVSGPPCGLTSRRRQIPCQCARWACRAVYASSHRARAVWPAPTPPATEGAGSPPRAWRAGGSSTSEQTAATRVAGATNVVPS